MPESRRKGPRGLPAIADARDQRARGATKWTVQAGLVAAGAIALAFVADRVVSGHALSADRQALLAKQRAVVVTVGAEWYPLRDALETDVLNAAKAYPGDYVDPEARAGAFRTRPGLYLRMRVADASDARSVRRVAADAKRDAFAACLLREPNERGVRGEIDGGAFAEQPWNLGQAYAATRILTEDWVAAVKDADDPMRLRVFTEQYDRAVKSAIPVAIDVVRRAEFFLFVLDEDVAEAAAHAEGGVVDEQALQLVGHPARVHLVDLKRGKEVLRLRRTGEARVIPAGEHVVTDQEAQEAMQRQANNCALAASVEAALADR